MKKIIILNVLLLVLSCKPVATVTNTKVNLRAQVAIKGNWTVTSVTYPGSEYIKVNSFQIADSKCFEGSTWTFISNNDSGEMALTNSSCPTFRSPIKWYVNKENQMILKILDAGIKAKKARDGYVLEVSNQTTESFQLLDKIDVGGKATTVVYEFKKVNK